MIELKCYKKGGIRVRIIAGKARGRKLIPPATMETRPTLDRVKESMFSMIQNYIPDAVVVDVFAGTGSLGLEAASRGAKEVYASCSHAVLSGQALDRIENSPIKELVYANTINIPEEKKLDKMVPLCVGDLIAKAIYKIHNNEPVSVLFE